MKRFFLMAAMLVAAATPQMASAQLNDIFSNPSSETAPETKSPEVLDIAGLLQSGGFEVVKQAEKLARVDVEHGGKRYPVVVYQSKNNDVLFVTIGLDYLPENAADYTDRILRLMELSGAYGPAFFSYNQSNRLIELYSSMEPSRVTASRLKTRIESMVEMATRHIDDWSASDWTTPRHVGSWSAKLDAETSLVIHLKADGSFELINQAAAGQATSIKGTYRLDRDNLVMTDSDGNEIKGEIYFVDGNHFNLNVNNREMSFERG